MSTNKQRTGFDSVFTWLRRFIKKFGFAEEQLTPEKLDFAINGLIAEEFGELIAAYKAKDSEETIDALGDLSWLCIKLMYQLNVNPYQVFEEIGTANVTKERGVKPGREQSGGFDVIKPEGWKGPDHSDNHGDLDEIYTK